MTPANRILDEPWLSLMRSGICRNGRLAILGVCALGLVSCQRAKPEPPAVERIVVGDTTIVRSEASQWPDTASLVEELTIGVLDGPAEYLFGGFVDLAVDESGGVYVFDGEDPALRYYDSSGAYLRTLGHEGAGPGEYRHVSLGLAVRSSDGRLVMRDPGNGRLNVYEADGSPSESWPVASGLSVTNAMTLDTADHMYLKVATGRFEPNKPWPIALMHMDDAGNVIDTLTPPVLPNEPVRYDGIFGIEKIWALSPLGGLVVGVNDRYMLQHFRPDGTVLRIEREVEPVRFSPGERQEWVDLNNWRRRTGADQAYPVPRTKPAFRSILVGQGGRIWVRRYVEGEKVDSGEQAGATGAGGPSAISYHEPTVYDVFDPSGIFLGTVKVPPRTYLEVVRGDKVWAIRWGSFDERQVVRFKIVVKG